MADFKTLFASNFFTRAQVEILRRLYQAIIDETSGGFSQADADLLYEPINSVSAHEAAADPHPGYLTPAEGNAAYAAIGHTHGSSDPWTYEILASDESTTTSGSGVAVTGLAFTPAANKSYEFEAMLLLRTSVTTTAVRAGVSWPTGLTDGTAVCTTPGAGVTSQDVSYGGISGTVMAGGTSLPSTSTSYLGNVKGFLIAGATPSGVVAARFGSETGGVSVTVKAGSFLRWREIQ